jgi:hypothetical protein
MNYCHGSVFLTFVMYSQDYRDTWLSLVKSACNNAKSLFSRANLFYADLGLNLWFKFKLIGLMLYTICSQTQYKSADELTHYSSRSATLVLFSPTWPQKHIEYCKSFLKAHSLTQSGSQSLASFKEYLNSVPCYESLTRRTKIFLLWLLWIVFIPTS